MEITDPEEIADTIDLGVTPLLVHVLCFPITALILILWSVAMKRMGLKINTVRGNGKVATAMATGGQKHRGSPANIDHHTVNNVMLDVNDTSHWVVTAY